MRRRPGPTPRGRRPAPGRGVPPAGAAAIPPEGGLWGVRRMPVLLLAVAAALAGCAGGGRSPARPPGPAAAPAPIAASHASGSAPASGGGSHASGSAPAAAGGSRTSGSARGAGSATAPLPAGVSVAVGWSATVLGAGFAGPDDLAAGADGTVYFSDITAGAVGALAPGGGAPRRVAGGLDVPEGIAVLPDGALLVAEQGRNRVLRIDAATGAASTWLALGNPTDLYGVDGIALAPGGLLIPDSPLGTVLRQPLAGTAPSGRPASLASGLHRPTSAVQVGGTIYVADETGNGLYAVPAAGGGAARLVVRLPQPDDVVPGPGGALLVGCLDGAVRLVDPVAGTAEAVLSGLGSPQGLAVDGRGFAVADESRNRIYFLEA